jgi:serine/threonine protein phosphatase 1
MAALNWEAFAPLDHAQRVWAVGSIHGERDKLASLHQALMKAWKLGDRLVYLGNFTGGGGDVIGTLDELLLFRRELLCRAGMDARDIVFLRGAQEEIWRKLQQIQFANRPEKVFEWMMAHGVEPLLRAYGEHPDAARASFREGAVAITRWTSGLRNRIDAHAGHTDLMINLRRAAYTEEGTLLLVHRGIDTSLSLPEQSDALWWGSEHFTAIDRPYEGFARIVRGFAQDHPGVAETDYTVTVDAGAGFGGSLVAACFRIDGTLEDVLEA